MSPNVQKFDRRLCGSLFIVVEQATKPRTTNQELDRARMGGWGVGQGLLQSRRRKQYQ
jgi:hypothetical protein